MPQAISHHAFFAAIAALGSSADEESHPFEAAERLALGIAAPVSRAGNRARKWVTKLHSFEGFADLHGRAPRENTRDRSTLPDGERRLGEWAGYQRRFETRLNEFQRVRLDVSPAFAWDPNEAAWEARRDQCQRAAVASQRLPFLNSADPIEFANARWFGRQLRHLQAGTLPIERAAAIEELLDWNRDRFVSSLTPARITESLTSLRPDLASEDSLRLPSDPRLRHRVNR